MNFLRTLLRRIVSAMQPTVFFGSAALVVGFIIFGALDTQHARQLFSAVQNFIVHQLGWFYVLSVTLLFLFVIWLYFSPYGSIRLGGDDARPEFGRFAWFTMLFSAGMGTGLVFWGVAEPLYHYAGPPMAAPETHAAVKESLQFAFFHWGLHPWAIYIVFGLTIAYFHFRHGLPLAPRSMLYPLIGERFRGIIGHSLDILCTVGTLFGVATSLGLGARQINSGLTYLFDIQDNTFVQIMLIAGITLLATISVVSGIHRGIKHLSQFNIILAFALLLFVFVAGPTLYQIKIFLTSTGDYLQNLVGMSLWVDARPDSDWQANWTLFYWGWWLSWSPFVGIFVARISRGRTIREFILYVSMVPTLVTFLWLAVFGGSAMHMELNGSPEILQIVQDNVALSLHALLDRLPFSAITTFLGTILILTFFITSSDSGSLVDDMVTSGGHPNPPAAQRIFWASAEGAVAAVLLYIGGLKALQTASLTTGLPLALFLLAACVGLVRALRADYHNRDVRDTFR